MSTVLRHDEAVPWAVPDRTDELRSVSEKLDRIAESVEALDARRQELEELFTDLMPAVNGALGIAIRQLSELEQDGSLAFAREAAGALGRIARTVEPGRLERIAANADALMRLAELAAAPELANMLEHAVVSLREADRGKPPRLRQLAGAMRESRVRRGLAAILDILRAMGGGTRGPVGSAAVPVRPPAPSAAPAPARKASPHRPAAECMSPPAATGGGSTRVLAGVPVAFDAEGFMAESRAWTREIAVAIAAENGISGMTDEHWNAIEFCRRDAAASGVPPGLRRITTTLGISPRDMYRLFPKGPGMLAARIAGLPKPKSCV